MTTKKDVLLATLANQPTDQILAGFWHHYLADTKQQVFGYRNLDSIQKVVTLQQQFFDQYQPDYTKIMSDNFFLLPSLLDLPLQQVTDLNHIEPVAPTDRWFQRQIEALKKIVAHYGNVIGSFYNIFSPWYQLRLRFEIIDGDDQKIYRFLKADPELFGRTLDRLADDLSELVTRLIDQTGILGIYLCVQQPQDPTVDLALWQQYVVPSEMKLLRAAQTANDGNILHICGFAGAHNYLADYRGYPFKAVNFATYVAHVTLAEGKQLFGGRTVLGGFDNTEQGVFYRGTRAEIVAETQRLLSKNGRQGILLGADCSVPFDQDDRHGQWVSQAANS
ncbi:uroporphyrinogen decarboxylase [Lactobacillus sp. CC-MHH1034]|uniref:uroporphyrinogen decarboxylase family protein n=1 Tax=Agrilactobacillus fermenti TaxID=2586909 RepID=UPI001E445A2D|nr:uroporphyrinogen decarboxylase family protein [Agrilactobacillus fermenti]MCD2257417.1 uroporphyrinogen decarboxylase [Agrilactobacillus fermenti]